MNPRALAVWSGTCLLIALSSTNPVYRGLVLLAAGTVVAATTPRGRSWRPLLIGLVFAALGAVALNAALSHLGATVLLELPAWLPLLGGPLTLESLAYGGAQGLGLAAAVLAFAPWSLAVETHQLVDALPSRLERTGTLLASALNLAPRMARTFSGIAEAQRMRGWRPRGPASWAQVLVPAMLTTMEDSIQLAEAMESRAFGSGPRSRFVAAGWAGGDLVVAAASALAAAGFMAGRLAGSITDWHPYPELRAPVVDPLVAAGCLLLLVPAVAWRWRPSSA